MASLTKLAKQPKKSLWYWVECAETRNGGLRTLLDIPVSKHVCIAELGKRKFEWSSTVHWGREGEKRRVRDSPKTGHGKQQFTKFEEKLVNHGRSAKSVRARTWCVLCCNRACSFMNVGSLCNDFYPRRSRKLRPPKCWRQHFWNPVGAKNLQTRDAPQNL